MTFIYGIAFYLLFSGNLFSQEIRAELSLITPPSVIREGDIIEGVVKVWPLENADLSEFNKLDNKTLGNALYVTEVESVEVSTNNADVVEAKLLFIVKRAAENTQDSFTYKGHVLNIQTPPLKIEPSDKDPEDYYVLEQNVAFSKTGKTILVLFLIGLSIFLILKRKALMSFFQKFKHDPVATSRARFADKFIKANRREEYEEIYSLRKEWQALIVESPSTVLEFLKTMEQHQYKKTWDTENLNEVKISFDYIRRSFK